MSDTGGNEIPLSEEDWLDQAMRAGGFGQWSLDVATGDLLASAVSKEIFGWTSESALSEGDLLEAVHPDDRGAFIDQLSGCVGDQKAFQLIHRLVGKGGEVLLVDTRGAAIAGPGNSPVRIAAVTVKVVQA